MSADGGQLRIALGLEMAPPAARLRRASSHAGAALRLVGDVDDDGEDSVLRFAVADLGWSSRVRGARMRAPPAASYAVGSDSAPFVNALSLDSALLSHAARILGTVLTIPTDSRLDSGFVSRVSPVQTALRNCTRDEGRPFEVGNQVLISSHRKLLLSKAKVVNVAETSGLDSDRQG
jgi:hypothetical protein